MEPKKTKFTSWLKTSITARMLIVGFLMMVLLIPLEFVKSLILERSNRQQEVVREINEKWGNEVILSGPILKIPYKTYQENTVFNKATKENERVLEERINHAYLFPDQLNINSNVTSKKEPLKRSIYESVVFTADLKISGNFPAFDLSEKDIKPQDILWDKITVLVKTTNLKGIRNTPEMHIAGNILSMTPKYSQEYLNVLETKKIPQFEMENQSPIPFSFEMKVNGSESLKFIPIGKETLASMTSNWHSPSFDGNFLPEDGSREITPMALRHHGRCFKSIVSLSRNSLIPSPTSFPLLLARN